MHPYTSLLRNTSEYIKMKNNDIFFTVFYNGNPYILHPVPSHEDIIKHI